jgi:hypothetical protein
MRKLLLTVCAAIALGLAPAAHARIPGAMEDCRELYNQFRAVGRAGGFRGDDLLKSTGSLCPDPSEAALNSTTGPSDWFLASTDGTCTPAHKMTPAWLMDYDRNRGIADSTQSENRNPDGTLASVEIVMPNDNGMVLVYHYFHTADGCTAYQAAKANKLNELK